jgi:acetyl esterase
MLNSRLTTKTAAVAAVAFLIGCQATPPVPPALPSADPTGMASPDMAKVLAEYQALGAKPVTSLTVAQARAQPTPGDAAAAVQKDLTGSDALIAVADVHDIQISGAAGPLPARVYDPKPMDHHKPIILYFHGGGWVTGDLNTYDASDRALAAGTGAVVLSVAYREGPETRFPGAHLDAVASYRWVLKHARMLGGDRHRIALAGESAGGNLAVDTAIAARDQHLPMPVHELLVYPVVGTDLNTPSYNETVNAIPLNRAAIQWYVAHYTTGPADLQDSRLNVIGGAILAKLPPTTIISAQIDPLRSEGEAFALKLRATGIDVQQQTFPGVTHEFFGMGTVVAQAKAAETMAITRLNESFYPNGMMPQ